MVDREHWMSIYSRQTMEKTSPELLPTPATIFMAVRRRFALPGAPKRVRTDSCLGNPGSIVWDSPKFNAAKRD